MAGGANTNIGRAFLQQSGMLGSPSPSYIAPSQLTTESAGYKPGYTGPSNISPMPTMRDNFAQRVSYAPLPRTSPLAQQMMDRSNAANPYGQGLQSIYTMFNRPQMPMYRVPALNYRPNMQNAQEVLRRVAPSVEEQRRLQAIEDARRAAEEAAAAEAEASAQNNDNYWMYNQG